MKRIKRLGALLLVLGLCAALAGLTVPRAADDGYIRMTNVIQISDKELLIEFSEPIAFNVNNGNRGPFICIRFVNKSDTVVWLNNDSKTKQAIQWQGSISTLRNDRSKLVFTLTSTAYGIKNISDITACKGELAQYAEQGYTPKFCIEEVPYNTKAPYTDGLVCNVTSPDGTRGLLASRPSGYESSVMAIQSVDYNYPIDRTNLVSAADRGLDATIKVSLSATPYQAKPEQEVVTQTVVHNDPLIVAVILGAGVLLAGAAVGISLVIRKKGAKKV